VRTRIENVFHVTPDTFWERLFFDAEYNAGVYRELGFTACEVLALDRLADGRVRRLLRAEPPIKAPDLLKRRLAGRVFYTEEGTYDPARRVWEFANESSMASDSTRVSGSIRAEPHAEGMLHVVELDIQVSAFGLGGMVEKLIEKNTRESYRVTTAFTNRFAREQGLALPHAHG
jgi:hypothetical protein